MNAAQNQDQRPFVIVSHTLPESWLASLAGRCRLLVGPETKSDSGLAPELARRLPEADGLFTLLTVPVDAPLLEKAPRLRVVSNMAVGVDNVDLAACSKRGRHIENGP